MKEEYRQEHFRVPEGYFESFTENMMSQLPDQPFQAIDMRKKRSWMPHIAAAAAVVFMASAVTLHFSRQDVAEDSVIKAQSITENCDDAAEYTMEEAAHYAMIDNQNVHYMLVDQ